MMPSEAFEPNWASPPSDSIVDILNHRDISIIYFAKLLEKDLQFTTDLIDGKIKIDEDLANRIGIILGPNAQFWKNREANYRSDLKRIEQMQKDRIILDYIETKMAKEQYDFRFYNWDSKTTWRVYDGPCGDESTEVIGHGPTLREAVENAIEHPYGN